MNVLKCECIALGPLMKCLLHDAFMYYLLKMKHSPFMKATALIYCYIITAVHNIVPVYIYYIHVIYFQNN